MSDPFRLRPIFYLAAIEVVIKEQEKKGAREHLVRCIEEEGEPVYKLEQRLFSSLGGLVESAGYPPVIRARGPLSPASPRAVRCFFPWYFEFFARSPTSDSSEYEQSAVVVRDAGAGAPGAGDRDDHSRDGCRAPVQITSP